MKILLSLAVLLAACLAGAQVRLSLSLGGKEAGTAVLTQRVNADGSKSVDLRIEMAAGAKKAKLTSQSSYDAKGNPIRKFLETIVPGQVQRQTVVTFDKAGANIVQINGDGRQTKKAALIDTAPRAAVSEFWFVRDTPKPGERVKGYVFNADRLDWELVETVYVGVKTIMLHGKPVQAHMVTSDHGDRQVASFLDDKGLPLLIEDGKMRMERAQEK